MRSFLILNLENTEGEWNITSRVHALCAQHALKGTFDRRYTTYKRAGFWALIALRRVVLNPMRQLRRMVAEPAPFGLGSGQLPEGWHGNCFGTVLRKECRFVKSVIKAHQLVYYNS